MNKSAIIELLKKYDFSFFGASFAIFIIGIINLYSSTHTSAGGEANLYQLHFLKFLLAFAIGFGISFIRPKNFYRYSYSIYFFNTLLLILVLLVGDKAMGAQRWLVIGSFRLQPSELMKISVVFALARWMVKSGVDSELGLKDLLIPGLIAAFPALLIIVEPDLGTGLLVMFIFITIAFYKKLKWKTMLIIALMAMLSGTLMYQFGLKEYQRKRITAFLNPDADTRGSGYNAIQSKIAIGSGQFFGKGFKKSSQASLNYLPENHTDFIFSIFNEEHGFFGSLVLISLYIVLLFRFIWLATSVNNLYEGIVVIGLMSIFFWHTFINMSMVMGLMPIVGIPLPYLSYGGSGLLTFGMACGVATSISNSRNLF